MKNLSIYTLLLAITLVAVQGCGPSEEEKRAAEQARLDSLRQVEQQKIAAFTAAREDSLALVAEKERIRAEEEANRIKFTDGGQYVVQVGAWRSEEKANSFIKRWSDRDFPSVYVVKIEEGDAGNVWFRVRVGFFETKEDAEKLGMELSEEINSGYWASKVQRTS
ncbi:MAG: SPOR domain-containing protein [Balneolaceae bacterium]